MKCENCNADVLELFRFCHKCGKSLKKTEKAAEQQPSVSKAMGKDLPTLPTLTTFEDFRKRLSSQRQENIKDKGKKKKTDTTSEVMMNIGRMKLVNGDLKPVKGKIMIVRVPVSIKKLELLRKGIDKHAAHDRTFDPFEDYTLLYPDGTEILTLPGQSTQIFQLDKYKEDIGKPFNRITLYLIERETLAMSRGKEDQSDSDYEMDDNSKTNSVKFSRKSTTTISVQPGKDASQTETNPDILVVPSAQSSSKVTPIRVDHDQPSTSAYNGDLQQESSFSSTINDSTTTKTANIQTLSDMFPASGEQEIVTALNTTQSLEEAIHLILNGSNSLNDAYASLMSANVDDNFDFNNDDNWHVQDFVSEATTSTFASDNSLLEKLKELKETELKSEEFLRLKVRRDAIWEDTLLKLSRLQPGELNKQVQVQFIGEPAVDQGGPSREFYTLINSAAQAKLMSDGVFRHNIASLAKKEFLAFGQLTAIGLLQGSPGPKCFSKSSVEYILSGKIDNLLPTLDEVPNAEVKRFLKNLDAITDDEEFKRMASFGCEFRFEAGYSKPFVHMKEKEEFFRCICLHYTVLSSITEINQFIDGLKTCNVLNLVRKNPEIFKNVFQVSKQLTAEQIDDIFDPVYSLKESNRYKVEQNIVFNFNQYLEDVEQGNVKTQVEGKDMNIMLKHVLQFITGAEDFPAIGFTPRPTLHFSHDAESKRKMTTNTCANILRIPVANMTDYSQFSEEFTFCMMNSPGFGVI